MNDDARRSFGSEDVDYAMPVKLYSAGATSAGEQLENSTETGAAFLPAGPRYDRTSRKTVIQLQRASASIVFAE